MGSLCNYSHIKDNTVDIDKLPLLTNSQAEIDEPEDKKKKELPKIKESNDNKEDKKHPEIIEHWDKKESKLEINEFRSPKKEFDIKKLMEEKVIMEIDTKSENDLIKMLVKKGIILN